MAHIIDLDKIPDWLESMCGHYNRGSWREVRVHVKGGQFEWSLEKVELYVPVATKYEELRKELDGLQVYNVNLMDFLLENQSLIPEEWKEKEIVFWGTHVFHFYGYCSGMVHFSMRFDGQKWEGINRPNRYSNIAIPVMKKGDE